MNLQKQKTNKLFFGKYPYKITCGIIGAYLIRNCGTSEILLENSPIVAKYIKLSSMYRIRTSIDFLTLRNFTSIAKEFINESTIKTRFERNSLDLYVLDKDIYEHIQKVLNEYVVKLTEPADSIELEKLLENNKYNLCNNLPYGKYKYKIIFKENIPINTRNNLITWAEKYSQEDIHIKESTKIHFKGIKYKYGIHYFYVKDYRMITMIHLVASDYIRKTEEFVIRTLEATA